MIRSGARTITTALLTALLGAIAAIVSCIPRRATAPLGVVVGWLFGSVLRVRRALVETAMKRAGVADPRRSARGMYRNLGRGLIDLLWLAGANHARRREAIGHLVTIDQNAIDALDRGLARGPVIFFASHTGNWELAAAGAARLLEEREQRLVIVAKGMSARGIDAFLSRLRASFGVKTIAPRGAFKAAHGRLVAGDVVVMPIDQVPDRASHGIMSMFLGKSALVDRAPATLAWRARATVLVVAHDGHRVRLLDTFAPPASARGASGSRGARGAREWIDGAMKRATSQLEDFIASDPESWMWLHRRWRAPRAPRAQRVVIDRRSSPTALAPAFRRT